MAQSRLEKIGTIYSRITGLIKSGAMPLEERPLWYEVYKAFPPDTPPVYDQKISPEPIKNIFYPEDKIRALFYKRLNNSPLGRLDDSKHQTLSQKCISSSFSLSEEKNISLEEAFEQVFAKIQNDMIENKITVKDTTTDTSPSNPDKITRPNLTNIFKET